MIATLSGTTYDAACAGLPVIEERRKGFGRQIKVEVPTLRELEDRLAEAACAAADEGRDDVTAAIYRDFERVTS